MNIYVAVILDSNGSIMAPWATYADNIREAKQLFDEEFGPLKDGYKVLFRLIKEG